MDRQPRQLVGRVVAHVAFAVKRAKATLVWTVTRGCSSRSGRLVTRCRTRTPFTAIADGEAGVASNLHVAGATLAGGTRVFAVAFAVAVLGIENTAVLALEIALRAVNARPVGVARA